MNLAALERLVREGDLSRDAFTYLLGCRAECEWLDYKEELHIESDPELCAFARDIIGMKNVGGGYLLVGVRDKTWDQVGLQTRLSFDSKQLRDKVQRATGLSLDIDIVHHELLNGGTRLHFALIHVRASKKRNKRRSPTVVAKDFCHNKPYGLRKGEIWVRRGDSTVRIASQVELEEVLDRLEEQSDRQQLEDAAAPSPFAIKDGTYRLLDRGFESFVGRVELRDRLLSAVIEDPRIWIINVHGPGGVGKTALVNWATHELYRRRSFEAILQLTAKEAVLTDAGIRAHGRTLYSLENLVDHILDLFEEPLSGDLENRRGLAVELLSTWRTLLVLDNMETVSDGRVLAFVQGLPPANRSKVLLTSRQKTGAWELPLAVSELNELEVREFILIKSSEIGTTLPMGADTAKRVGEISGGLPLAIQWIIGQYKLTNNLDRVLSRMRDKESPVLEFSFRNIWNLLSGEAKTVLAVMSVFDGPCTLQQLGIATEMHLESIERSMGELAEVTLVTRTTQQSDGRVFFSALPITLSFARHQLAGMGDLEVRCRQRLNKFAQQLDLQAAEVGRFRSTFEQYGLASENERRAAVLCRRAESEVFAGHIEQAETLFEQAKDLAPQSSYVHAMIASFNLTQMRIGAALERITEACRRATTKTGALCYTIKARILDEQRDRTGTVEAYAKALEFGPNDVVVRHQYGVALSRAGRTQEAVDQFTTIIETERIRVPPRDSLLMALTTRVINLRRLGRSEDANQDLRLAADLIRRHPHLEQSANRLRDMMGDE